MSRNNEIVIPFGWKRQIQNEPSTSLSSVTYVSPSGIILSSIAEVCQYLENDTTCKCGLQCPLHVPKVFSFNPEVQSVEKTRKEWIFLENRNILHKTNCMHWDELQKACNGMKTSTDIVCEPPPKLLIIRKEGRLTSVIPDKDNASSGNPGSRKEVTRKKPSGFADMSEIAKSDLSVSASKKSSSLKLPLFEAVSSTSAQIKKTTDESKSDFKLQWIKADDELSHNDSESENELCFSPDLKNSPPMSFPQLSLPGVASTPATHVKLEGRQGMMNTTYSHYFTQSSHSSLMTSHMGVEPIHRFGMSAFPGTNFVTRNNSGIGVNVNNQSLCSHQQLPRYPVMSIKSERQSFQGGGIPSGGVRFSHSTNFVGGPSRRDQERLYWNSNELKSSLASNVRMQNVGGSSQVGQRTPAQPTNSSARQPISNQQYPLRSPPLCNQGSPFCVVSPGQIMPLQSPGQRTNASPFSNKSNSSLGTPSPLPPGQRQGGRMVYTQDASRPLSRSSNTSTPKADIIPSPVVQWNSGMPGGYSTRTPCSAHSYNPVLSSGPISPPFSPQRFIQSARLQSNVKQQNLQLCQEYNQSLAIGNNGFSNPNIKQQHMKNMVSPNAQQRTPQPFPPIMNPHFGTNLKMQSNLPSQRFVAHKTAERSSVSNSHIFSPNVVYQSPRVRYATINEPEPNNMEQGFSMPITNTNIKNPQPSEQAYYHQGFQPHMAWLMGDPRLPTPQNPYQQVVISHSKYGATRMRYPSAQQTKPKPKRVRKNSKIKVKNSPSSNSSLMTCDLPDFLDPQRQALTFEKSLAHSSGNFGISHSGTFNHHSLSNTQEPESLLQDSSPSLVIPQILQSSQTDALERSSRTFSSNAKQGYEMNTSLNFEATSKTLVDHTVARSKQSERSVTTPPLPLLSPASMLDERNDNDDISEFGSPSNVFSFPINFSDSKTIAATYLTPNSHSRQEKLEGSGTKPVESVKIPQNILSKPVSNFKTSAMSFAHLKSAVFKSPFQCSVSNVENTLLVSSSGKVFRTNVPGNKCRRFSDSMSVDVSSTPQSDARKRIRSDPFPSITQCCSGELSWRRQSFFQQRGDRTSRCQLSSVPIFSESASVLASESNPTNKIGTEASRINIHSIINSQKSACDSHQSIITTTGGCSDGTVTVRSESLAQDKNGDSPTYDAPETPLKGEEKVPSPNCSKAKSDNVRANELKMTDLMTPTTSERKISYAKIDAEMRVVGVTPSLAAKSAALCDYANTEKIAAQEVPNSQHRETGNATENVFSDFASNSFEKAPENSESRQSEIPNAKDNFVIQKSLTIVSSDDLPLSANSISKTRSSNIVAVSGAKTEVPVFHPELRPTTSAISNSQHSSNSVSDSSPKSMPLCNIVISQPCSTVSDLARKDSEKLSQSGFLITISRGNKPREETINPVKETTVVEDCRNEFGTSRSDLSKTDACNETHQGDNVSDQEVLGTRSGGSVSPLAIHRQLLPDNSTTTIGITKSSEAGTVTDTKDYAPTLKVLGNENARMTDDSAEDMTSGTASVEANLKHKEAVEEKSKRIADSPKVVKKTDSSNVAVHAFAASECCDNKHLKPQVEGNSELPGGRIKSSAIGCLGSSALENTPATTCPSDTFRPCLDKYDDTDSFVSITEKRSDSDKSEERIQCDKTVCKLSANDSLELDTSDNVVVVKSSVSSSPFEGIYSDKKSECVEVPDQVLENDVVTTSSLSRGVPSYVTEIPRINEGASELNICQVDKSVKLPATSSINLGLSPDLTDTVIRQLSNYNTFLKNLLVSGVGPVNSAALSQFTAGAVVSDEDKAKLISTLLTNNGKMNNLQPPAMLLKDSIISGIDLPMSSSSSVGVSTNLAADSCEPSNSFSGSMNRSDQGTVAKRIYNSNKVQDSLSLLDTRVLDSSEVDKTLPANRDMANQGLQVPIVSSSVKGTHTDDISENEKDVSVLNAKSDLVKTESKSIHLVLDEVSTSTIKEVDSSEPSSNKDSISTDSISIAGPRRGRLRNSAGKIRNPAGNFKRSAVESLGEKPQKRSLANAGVQMPSNLRPIHRPSEKLTRVFKSGDLVWGQMRGYPSWPGKIVKPSEVRSLQQRAPLSDGKAWVKWFGDHTFTQMNPADLRTMTEGLEAHHKSRMKGRTRNRKISIHLETAIQEAVDELEQQQELKQANVKKIPDVAATTITESQATDVVKQSKKRRCKRKKR